MMVGWRLAARGIQMIWRVPILLVFPLVSVFFETMNFPFYQVFSLLGKNEAFNHWVHWQNDHRLITLMLFLTSSVISIFIVISLRVVTVLAIKNCFDAGSAQLHRAWQKTRPLFKKIFLWSLGFFIIRVLLAILMMVMYQWLTPSQLGLVAYSRNLVDMGMVDFLFLSLLPFVIYENLPFRLVFPRVWSFIKSHGGQVAMGLVFFVSGTYFIFYFIPKMMGGFPQNEFVILLLRSIYAFLASLWMVIFWVSLYIYAVEGVEPESLRRNLGDEEWRVSTKSS